MVPDPATFPSGMKAVGDYIHSLGLKYGVYSSAGNWTCQGRAGSLFNEDIDAADFAAWGVDYLKYDNCYN
jgi:alpha-galactosidase